MPKRIVTSQLYNMIVQNNGIVHCDDLVVIRNDMYLFPEQYRNKTIKNIVFTGKIKFYCDPVNLFVNFAKVESIDCECFDMSEVNNLSRCFANVLAKEIKCSTWNTSNCEDLSNCFNNCVHLTNVDLSHWNLSKSYNIDCMFRNCCNIKNWDFLNTWDAKNILYSNYTFVGSNIQKQQDRIDLSNWETKSYNFLANSDLLYRHLE